MSADGCFPEAEGTRGGRQARDQTSARWTVHRLGQPHSVLPSVRRSHGRPSMSLWSGRQVFNSGCHRFAEAGTGTSRASLAKLIIVVGQADQLRHLAIHLRQRGACFGNTVQLRQPTGHLRFSLDAWTRPSGPAGHCCGANRSRIASAKPGGIDAVVPILADGVQLAADRGIVVFGSVVPLCVRSPVLGNSLYA